MSARIRAKRMRSARLRVRLQACRTRECEAKARADAREVEDKLKRTASAQASRIALQKQKELEGRADEKTFITPDGKVMVLNEITGKYEQRGGIESRGFDIRHPIQQIRKDFRKTIGKSVDILQDGTELVFQAVLNKEERAQVFTFILNAENKVRAAIVIADAISLGLITVGGALSGTVVGAAIGGPLAAAGFSIGAVSKGVGTAVNITLATIKRIKQLEDAVEVARINALKLFGENREQAIKDNQEAIEARTEELEDLKSTELTSMAGDLGITTTGLSKSDKARKIAEAEIIGIELVEPTVGKSLLAADIEALKKKKEDKEKEEAKLKEEVEKEEAKLQDVVDKKQAELQKVEDKVKAKEDEIIRLLGVDRTEAKKLVAAQQKKELKKKEEADKKARAELKALQDELREDDEKASKADDLPLVALGSGTTTDPVIVSNIDKLKEVVEAVKTVPKVIKLIKETKGLVITKEDLKDLPDKPKDFTFSSITNEEIINKATRRPLEAAMKTDAVNKVKNFTNPKKLTAAQTQGKKSDNTEDKQKAALINANADRNIYNDMVEDFTTAATNEVECRKWLTNNVAKITILPDNLKKEFRDYCESIMKNDTEEI